MILPVYIATVVEKRKEYPRLRYDGNLLFGSHRDMKSGTEAEDVNLSLRGA